MVTAMGCRAASKRPNDGRLLVDSSREWVAEALAIDIHNFPGSNLSELGRGPQAMPHVLCRQGDHPCRLPHEEKPKKTQRR